MPAIRDVIWERDPHTAAKHALLKGYLDAWFPIMSRTFGSRGIRFVDGFAGPGEYTNSRESSPVIVMEQALRPEVRDSGAAVTVDFIEADARRVRHLIGVLEREFPAQARPAYLTVNLVPGDCEQELAQVLGASGTWQGPLFANLDGWGHDVPFELLQRVAQNRSSEVLVTFQERFFTRFVDRAGEDAHGDRVFGTTDWRTVSTLPSNRKRPYLVDLYRQRVTVAGFAYVLMFEMIDEGGRALYQFFGTNSDTAVERFKDALWKVDGLGGQRFRDPKDPDQLAFGLASPDFRPLCVELERLIREGGPQDLATLKRHTLLNTIYKKVHAKTAVADLVNRGKVRQVRSGRSDADRIYDVGAEVVTQSAMLF